MVARCMEGAIEWLLGAWRAHEGYTKGAQRTCKGCGRGMEWLLGVQRGNRVVTRCRQGMQRVHEGTWRACGEHSPSVHLATIPYPSTHPPCALCTPSMYLAMTPFPLCTPSNHSISLLTPSMHLPCVLRVPSNHSIFHSTHLVTIPYPSGC